MDERDELDNPEVAERLRRMRRESMHRALRGSAMEPLPEGETPKPIAKLDAFGRGPGSPFYVPDYQPPWAKPDQGVGG